jgi:hypothetical protein
MLETHQSDLDIKDESIKFFKETTDKLSKENKKLNEKHSDQEEEGNLYDNIIKIV